MSKILHGTIDANKELLFLRVYGTLEHIPMPLPFGFMIQRRVARTFENMQKKKEKKRKKAWYEMRNRKLRYHLHL